MPNNTSRTQGELIALLHIQEEKYQDAIHGDLSLYEVKPIFLNMKELKKELEKLTKKTESLNARFAEEINKFDNALKKLDDGLRKVKSI